MTALIFLTQNVNIKVLPSVPFLFSLVNYITPWEHLSMQKYHTVRTVASFWVAIFSCQLVPYSAINHTCHLNFQTTFQTPRFLPRISWFSQSTLKTTLPSPPSLSTSINWQLCAISLQHIILIFLFPNFCHPSSTVHYLLPKLLEIAFMALPVSRLCCVQSTLKVGLENTPAKTSRVV